MFSKCFLFSSASGSIFLILPKVPAKFPFDFLLRDSDLRRFGDPSFLLFQNNNDDGCDGVSKVYEE